MIDKKTPTEVELLWKFQTKDNMATLVGELYGQANEYGGVPIYDFGHPNRGFETFQQIVTISDLKDSRFYDTIFETLGLEAKIDASSLLKQLGKVMKDYLDSDPENLKPEWYEKQFESHKRASDKLREVEVTLRMEPKTVKIQNLPSPESKYELVEYSIHLPSP